MSGNMEKVMALLLAITIVALKIMFLVFSFQESWPMALAFFLSGLAAPSLAVRFPALGYLFMLATVALFIALTVMMWSKHTAFLISIILLYCLAGPHLIFPKHSVFSLQAAVRSAFGTRKN